MTIKKLLAALGLMCVVAPALAATVLMNRSSSDPARQQSQAVVDTILQSLQSALAGQSEVGEGSPVASAAKTEARLPTRATESLVPNLSDIKLPFGMRGAGGGLASTEQASGMTMASGPVQIGGPGGQQARVEDTRSFATNVTNNRSGRGGGAPSGGAGGGSGGGSDNAENSGQAAEPASGTAASGFAGPSPSALQAGFDDNLADDGSLTDLALGAGADERTQDVGASQAGISVMPLPASVWMLLASMLGLTFLGQRRRTRA